MKAPVSLCLHQYLVFSVFSVLQPVCHILLISIRIWLIHTLKDFFSLCSFSFSHVVLYCLFGLILKSEFSSVTQSCPTLCNPMDCSMPDFPVYHHLPEPAQTQVHLVGDVIQLSHLLSSPSPPVFKSEVLKILLGALSRRVELIFQGLYSKVFFLGCFVLSYSVQFSSVQLLSHVRLYGTPWTAARQASLSITNCHSLPKPMSIESVMPSNDLILYRPLLLLPSIFASIWVFSNESALCIR